MFSVHSNIFLDGRCCVARLAQLFPREGLCVVTFFVIRIPRRRALQFFFEWKCGLSHTNVSHRGNDKVPASSYPNVVGCLETKRVFIVEKIDP